MNHGRTLKQIVHKHMVDNDDDDERPEDSAGAQCIRFQLLTYQFGPTFVHQVFPDERIPGYLPPKVVEDESLSTLRPRPTRGHPSFRGSRAATKYLSILVTLTASCLNASLKLDVLPIPVVAGDNLQANKRRRLNHDNNGNDDDEEDIGSEDSETDEDDLDSCQEEGVAGEEWTLDQVRTSMESFLPPLLSQPHDDDESQFLSALIGTETHSYTTNDQRFVLSIATATQCATYHQAVQKLSYWFIDAASDIDITPDSTEWKVLYLFQRHGTNDTLFSLAGFMTLYHFFSPFRKPVGGCIVRVCQALVLPPYQRMGHGQRMLQAVFDYAHQSRAEPIVVEVNCENPAPGFQILRTVVDYQRFVDEGSTWFKDPTSCAATSSPSSSSLCKPLRESLKAYALKQSLTTPAQILKVYEIDTLMSIKKSFHSDDPSVIQQYTTIVRSRLEKDHEDELGELETNEATVRLNELLSAELTHHETVMRRVHGAKALCTIVKE
jgi:ribosomal protein S18 acetylase RimI-like enzyme